MAFTTEFRLRASIQAARYAANSGVNPAAVMPYQNDTPTTFLVATQQRTPSSCKIMTFSRLSATALFNVLPCELQASEIFYASYRHRKQGHYCYISGGLLTLLAVMVSFAGLRRCNAFLYKVASMTPSPLLLSMTFVTSISVLTAGVAWSAYEAHEKQTALNSSKAKAVRAKTPKSKQTFVKPVSSNPETGKVKLVSTLQLSTPQQPHSQAASSSAPTHYVPAAANEISQNPYFANQPAAILPLAARPVATNPTLPPVDVAPVVAAPAITPAVVAPVVIGPVIDTVSAPTISIPTPAVTATAAPVSPALPSLVPPIYSAAAPVPTNSYSAPVAAYQAWNTASTGIKSPSTNPYLNPYLNYRTYQPQPPAASAPVQPFNPSFSNPFSSSAFKFSLPSLPSFPSLPQASNLEPAAYKPPQFNAQQIQTPKQAATASTGSGSSILSSLKMMIPLTGDSNILPTIKKVYPTGEKPLVVLNFKCPTEVVGITPPPMKLLHEAVNLGFDGLNKTNLLSFNLQQVCS